MPRGSSGLRKRLSLGLVASHGTVPAHSPGCSSLSDGLAAPLCSAPLFAVPSFRLWLLRSCLSFKGQPRRRGCPPHAIWSSNNVYHLPTVCQNTAKGTCPVPAHDPVEFGIEGDGKRGRQAEPGYRQLRVAPPEHSCGQEMPPPEPPSPWEGGKPLCCKLVSFCPFETLQHARQ